MVDKPPSGPGWLEPGAGSGRGFRALRLTAIIGLVECLVWAGLGIAKVWFGADPMRKALIIYAADNFGSITLALVTTAYVVFTYHLLESAEAGRRQIAEPFITARWQTSGTAAPHQADGIKEWVLSACEILKAAGIAVDPPLPESATRYVHLELSNAKETPVTWLQLRVSAPALMPALAPLNGQIDLNDLSMKRGDRLLITVADVGALPDGIKVALKIDTLVYGSADPMVSIREFAGDRNFVIPGSLVLRAQPPQPESV